MLDYLQLQGSTENPTLVTTIFTLLLSFLLSSVLAFTFEKTTEEVMRPVRFIQSLILVSVVAAMVMQAIGDSLARGLGMLGAMAIIRFRTNLKTPRNMVFVFASLAAGIACGVYGYVIGIVGTMVFCLVAFALHYSPMAAHSDVVGSLRFDLPKSSTELEEVEKILKQFCRKFKRVRIRVGAGKKKAEREREVVTESDERLLSYEYQISLKGTSALIDLDSSLTELKTLRALNINFENNLENI
jgi:uncharacterized membrane protein YhiD involved in acid resistance